MSKTLEEIELEAWEEVSELTPVIRCRTKT